MTSSAGPVCVQKEQGCSQGQLLSSTGLGEGLLKVSETSQRSTLVVKLISDVVSSCNQQPGLSSTGWGRVIPEGRAIASPQADAIQRGVLCLEKMASAVWGLTQHMDPGALPSVVPRTTNSLYTFLVHSALPLPEPRVSGCK